MSARLTIWSVLEIEPTQDSRAIRRAYAKRLKAIDPEADPAGFQLLRESYERALAMASRAMPDPEPDAATVEAPGAHADAVASVTNTTPAPAAAPVDEQLHAAVVAYSQIELALRQPPPADPSAELKLLENLLDSEAMDRLDIHQRTEVALANLLAGSLPRSEHLLQAASNYFDWEKRTHEAALPPAARAVVARIDELGFISDLRWRKDAFSRAYERLQSEKPGRWTWIRSNLRAYPGELEVLRELSSKHRGLLAQIPDETLMWWDRFARQPRLSRPLLLVGLTFTLLGGIPAFFQDPAGLGKNVFRGIAIWLAITLGAVAFKYFVLDKPAVRIRERWAGHPPHQLEFGWLPATIVLLFATVAVREIAWASWIVAAMAVGAWVWACLMSTPAPVVSLSRNALEARWLRALLASIPLSWWLLVCSAHDLAFSAPSYVAFLFVLFASGIGREQQGWSFRMLLDARRRAISAAGGLLLVLGCLAWVIASGGAGGFKPWIIATVMALMLLRRVSPHGLALGGHWLIPPIVLFAGWAAAAWVVHSFELDPRVAISPDASAVVIGALMFLAGAAYSFTREIVDALRSREPAGD